MKQPRIFYFDEGHDAWFPVSRDLSVWDLICNTTALNSGDDATIRFKREDMTDEEISALPEA